MQQGSIGVSSEVGKGSNFFFDILYMLSHRKPVAVGEKKIAADEVHLENLRILLVENNPFNRMVAKDTLEAVIMNANVDIAGNGLEAISCILNNHYDIVLMDLNMPVMDGYEATRRIRAELPHPKNKVKIMAISASSTKQERDECIEAGMSDYLAKPFLPEELKLKIASLVENGKATIARQNGNSINLDFLEEVTGGDKSKKVKYINMYLQDTPALFNSLKKGIENTDWETIREASHTLISQFHYVGAEALKKTAREIETKAKSKIGLEEITGFASELESAVQLSYAEMNRLLQALSDKK